MRRLILAALLALAAWPALGQALPSPTYNRVIIQGPGSAGDISAMSARPNGSAAARTFADWFSDRANVAAFPGADLSAKYAAACASLPASGGTIYIPRRTWTAAGRLVCDGKAVSVIGDGPGVTIVQFTSAALDAAGMSFSPGDFLRPVTVQDMSLLTLVDQVNGNAAITIRYGAATSNIFKGPRISNVEIASPGNNTAYWGRGIDAYNVWGFDFHGVHVRGKDIGGVSAYPANAMDAAIHITGQFGGGCSDGKVSAVNAFFVRYVGKVVGDCEGVHWTDNTGVAVDVGISYEGAPAAPGFFIARNHFNTFRYGVNNTGFVQGMIHDNLFYKWANSAQTWIGVGLSRDNGAGGNNNFVHHNIFVNTGSQPGGGDVVGVAAIDVDGNVIDHNQFISLDWVFDFGGANTANTAKDNTVVNLKYQWNKALGLSTISGNNTPLNAGTEPATIPMGNGTTSMNVGAWFQRVFTTGNNAATTMVDFTNAEAGRQITIIAQDANTTVAHNARVRLRGGANMTMASGASLTLLYTGTFWQEIGRSQ